MEKSNYEKRFFERYPYKGNLNYMRMGDTSSLPDTSYSNAEILNISSGGLCLKLDQPKLNEGTLLIVKIQLPDISASIPVIARVQWISEIGEKSYQAGIKFILGN